MTTTMTNILGCLLSDISIDMKAMLEVADELWQYIEAHISQTSG